MGLLWYFKGSKLALRCRYKICKLFLKFPEPPFLARGGTYIYLPKKKKNSAHDCPTCYLIHVQQATTAIQWIGSARFTPCVYRTQIRWSGIAQSGIRPWGSSTELFRGPQIKWNSRTALFRATKMGQKYLPLNSGTLSALSINFQPRAKWDTNGEEAQTWFMQSDERKYGNGTARQSSWWRLFPSENLGFCIRVWYGFVCDGFSLFGGGYNISRYLIL